MAPSRYHKSSLHVERIPQESRSKERSLCRHRPGPDLKAKQSHLLIKIHVVEPVLGTPVKNTVRRVPFFMARQQVRFSP